MDSYDTDLHIHSPHSIAVSKNLNLDTMVETSKMKGLKILGTGDITQPDWRKYLANNLEYNNGVYSYKGINFIIQTELEDIESIHHVVLLPNIKSGEELQQKITKHTKNVTGQWAGRPHVNVSPAEIVDIVETCGGISGPAHAFTPFKAIFRQGKFSNLEECYGGNAKKVYFIELGLSADTDVADRMSCLKDITFLSNSDAHSEGPQSLGREFNRFDVDNPSFEEILSAIRRKDGRKITLNVGMEPRLGKYPLMFCKGCRKRVKLLLEKDVTEKIKALPKTNTLTGSHSYDDEFIYYFFSNGEELASFKRNIGRKKIKCPSCEKLSKPKNSKLNFGVYDRADEISDFPEPKHPSHRPPYFGTIPLVEMIRVIKGVASVKASSVRKEYNSIISKYGNEFRILTDDLTLKEIDNDGFKQLADLIAGFRKKKIQFKPGGGGKYGEIDLSAI